MGVNTSTNASNSVALLQKPANFEADILYVKKGYTQNADLTALLIGKFAKNVLISEDNSFSYVKMASNNAALMAFLTFTKNINNNR